jgi:hypothetical protein
MDYSDASDDDLEATRDSQTSARKRSSRGLHLLRFTPETEPLKRVINVAKRRASVSEWRMKRPARDAL